jgi:DnaK suppressor protein
MDAGRARERLAEERARIERELEGIGAPDAPEEPEDRGDQADDLVQAGTDNALREDLRQTLAAIERAEQRLEEGTYGKSVISGEPIPDERLEAIPWADRRVDEEPGGRST